MRIDHRGCRIKLTIRRFGIYGRLVYPGEWIMIHVVDDQSFDIERDLSRERALERIRAYRKKLPPGWKFDRDDANTSYPDQVRV
jgi:hypothetical protein